MKQIRPLLRAPRPRRFGTSRALAVGAAVGCAALTASHVPAAPHVSPETVVTSLGSDVRTYAAVGDSITAGMVQGADSLNAPVPTAWLNGVTATRLVRVGGPGHGHG
jgi:hypothetical protein